MEKVNFSGGEPFLHDRGHYIGEMVKFCKQELELPSVTIVSNGSLITDRWFKLYGKYYLEPRRFTIIGNGGRGGGGLYHLSITIYIK